jgi:hypothetical protein
VGASFPIAKAGSHHYGRSWLNDCALFNFSKSRKNEEMEEMKNQCTRCSIVRIRNDGKLPLPDRYFLGLGSGSVWGDLIIHAFPFSGHFKHF